MKQFRASASKAINQLQTACVSHIASKSSLGEQLDFLRERCTQPAPQGIAAPPVSAGDLERARAALGNLEARQRSERWIPEREEARRFWSQVTHCDTVPFDPVRLRVPSHPPLSVAVEGCNCINCELINLAIEGNGWIDRSHLGNAR